MVIDKVIIELLLIVFINAVAIPDRINNAEDQSEVEKDIVKVDDGTIADIFNGVYTDCFLHLSYSCLQKKTLIYLKELNKLSEVSVIGDYVKFVKLNTTDPDIQSNEDIWEDRNSEELSFMIDQAVDKFFDNHIMKFSALGRNISVPNTEEGFVGRKKRKGGGGGGGGGGHMGGFGHDDGGKKKMMMMAMMCMKMKLMMMVPAMMGMMGMMSFKGMMFSMMSFMISKMMLLMKILEKKGLGGGGGGGGGGDGGWAAGGGGGGAWMPAGAQDYGGGGGGYDANGQWQSRSIYDMKDMKDKIEKEPIISYVIPTIRYNHKNVIAKDFKDDKIKSRKKRGIIDALQNIYLYWMNQILGGNRRKSNNQRYKIVNGVKYVYYPNKVAHKFKMLQVTNPPKVVDEFKPIIIAEDFNKGETVEGGIESRMNNKKFHRMKDTVNDTFDENPWE